MLPPDPLSPYIRPEDVERWRADEAKIQYIRQHILTPESDPINDMIAEGVWARIIGLAIGMIGLFIWLVWLTWFH